MKIFSLVSSKQFSTFTHLIPLKENDLTWSSIKAIKSEITIDVALPNNLSKVKGRHVQHRLFPYSVGSTTKLLFPAKKLVLLVSTPVSEMYSQVQPQLHPVLDLFLLL